MELILISWGNFEMTTSTNWDFQLLLSTNRSKGQKPMSSGWNCIMQKSLNGSDNKTDPKFVQNVPWIVKDTYPRLCIDLIRALKLQTTPLNSNWPNKWYIRTVEIDTACRHVTRRSPSLERCSLEPCRKFKDLRVIQWIFGEFNLPVDFAVIDQFPVNSWDCQFQRWAFKIAGFSIRQIIRNGFA